MKTKMKMPTYLSKFSCIGGECEDNCCKGFTVPIDERTYKLYENIKDDKLREKLLMHVKKNENPTSPSLHASINARHGCPFLTGEGWCGIHADLGERFLSSPCSKYPRHISAIDKDLEKWGTLSCPEIARLALLPKEGLSFEIVEEEVDVERDIATFQLSTEALPVTKHFYELRDFTIEVLKDRTMNLDERMLKLEHFYHDLNELINAKEEEKTIDLIEYYKELPFVGLESDDEEFDLQTFVDVALFIRERSEFVWRYEEVFAEMLSGFEKGISNHGFEFINDYSHILENYLVHYVFQKLFPFSYGNTIFEAYQMMKLQYQLIQVHILGVASHLKNMDEKNVIRIIQSFAKEGEHNSAYMPSMFRKLMK